MNPTLHKAHIRAEVREQRSKSQERRIKSQNPMNWSDERLFEELHIPIGARIGNELQAIQELTRRYTELKKLFEDYSEI